MKLESKTGKIEHPDDKIFSFLTNFNNFRHLIPEDKVRDFQSDESSCSFKIDPLGQTGFKIVEKTPNSLIKINSLEGSKFDFSFWIQLKKIDENDTRVKLTLEAHLNPFIQMMAKKPLEDFLNTLIDQITRLKF